MKLKIHANLIFATILFTPLFSCNADGGAKSESLAKSESSNEITFENFTNTYVESRYMDAYINDSDGEYWDEYGYPMSAETAREKMQI